MGRRPAAEGQAMVNYTLRVPAAIRQRLDELAEQLAGDPSWQMRGRIDASDVAREALARGIADLEGEAAAKRPSHRNRKGNAPERP